MDARVRFIGERIIGKFKLDRAYVDDFLSTQTALATLFDFFKGDGRPSVTFYHQPASPNGNPSWTNYCIVHCDMCCIWFHDHQHPSLPNPTSDTVRAGLPELFLNPQSTVPLTGRAIYFVRTSTKSVVEKTIDADVCVGELRLAPDDVGEPESNPMADLDQVIGQVQKSFVAASPAVW